MVYYYKREFLKVRRINFPPPRHKIIKIPFRVSFFILVAGNIMPGGAEVLWLLSNACCLRHTILQANHVPLSKNASFLLFHTVKPRKWTGLVYFCLVWYDWSQCFHRNWYWIFLHRMCKLTHSWFIPMHNLFSCF